ncbi:2'-5' RNA ligase family protein [Nocardia yamanashiensis]|uniref:2'-5' RNA ligase family protein n=1 Tax=Nocardia yamanashiensis TaxID=209247 RepID=UPI001E493A8C|nr:2'-5' RNA ligase family protein [Nocardia yamanashiensis]UGT45167.1 2'-5' RNA ligase family protein [Nocardia yamanashiensis]
MINHWGRNEWPAGHEIYYWYLTFRDPKLVEMTKQCRTCLKPDGIDFVPLDGLHITVLGIGGRDEIAEHDIQAVANDARAQLRKVNQFDLTVGPLAGSRGALRFTVAPWTELFQLHQILEESTRKVLPDLPIVSTQRFRPHLGIGYSNQLQEAEPFIEQVAALRDTKPVTVRVDAIKLVRLRREPRAYRWDDVATLDLNPS